MPRVVTVATPELGDRSYLLHDGFDALVVDPQRDLKRILDVAADAGVRVACVAETHLHNDYVSGGLELARLSGCDYLLAEGEELGFAHRPVSDGQRLAVGAMQLAVVATPGHTPGHLAYLVAGGGGEDQVVCSGGSMLFGSVGRTDLAGEQRADELSRAQYRSVRRLASELDPATAVLPTHGFGSFCSSTPPSGGDSTTIGEQRRENLALTVEDEDRFVEILTHGFTRYPAYYAEMAPINRAGPPPAPGAPVEALDPRALAGHLAAGGWVVDLRARREFAAAHLAGSVGFEQSQPFTTYLGWVVPSSAPLVLLGDSAAQLAVAGRDLTRIGRDGPHGGLAGATAQLAAAASLPVVGYEVTDFRGLAAALSGPGGRHAVVLDVRGRDEWSAAHVAGSVNVFVADLPASLASVPPGRVLIHCASGYRAAVAAGVLHRDGRDVVLVDDDWSNAPASGVPIEP